MTPEEFAQRSCYGKVPFASRREARQRIHNLGGGRVAPYRCRIDDEHWHLGHAVSKCNRKRNAS